MGDNREGKYIAITIGPIMDTMNIVTKPAALWLSSYMFSYISKQLCVLIADRIQEENVITPYIPKKSELDHNNIMNREDGVGLFHDHIIFKDIDNIWEELPGIIESVTKDVALKLGVAESLLKKYLMIKVCRFDVEKDENPILCCGKILDCMELSKVFSSTEEIHPIKSALGNKSVKEIAKNFVGIDSDKAIDESKWNLICTSKENGQVFKDIPSIAYRKENYGLKKNNYYCLLRADGDHIGQIISSLGDNCRDFSKVCFEYCDKVANSVRQYGGITIFAGGDDLFALVPCEGETGTVLDLVLEIDRIFNESFGKYIDEIKIYNVNNPQEQKNVPSLSFGVFICHKKHPLYEAVSNSATLLFDVAKKKNNEKKNCLALQLQKHSGQCEELLMSKTTVKALAEMLNNVLEGFNNKEKYNEAFLLSAAYKILTFDKLIDFAHDKEEVFKNIFDASFHTNDETLKKFLHKKLPALYKGCCETKGLILLEKHQEKESPSQALAQAIRIVKFFIEKGDA